MRKTNRYLTVAILLGMVLFSTVKVEAKTASRPSTVRSTSMSIKSTSTKGGISNKTRTNHYTVKAKPSIMIKNKGYNNYKINPKTDDNNKPSYYTKFSSEAKYKDELNAFIYYGIDNLEKDSNGKIKERDIVKALEVKGYTNDEIDSILKDINTENKITSTLYGIIGAIFVLGMCSQIAFGK